MPFKDFYKDDKKAPFKKFQRVTLYPKKPETQVKKKFKDIAIFEFGVCKEYRGHWSLEFIRKFPLALQLTHDNYTLFYNWLWEWEDPDLETSELGVDQLPNPYARYFNNELGFTLDWWHEYDSMFLSEKWRRVNPLYFIFDLHSRRYKITDKSKRHIINHLTKEVGLNWKKARFIMGEYYKSSR